MTQPPTRDELVHMLVQCVENHDGNVRNPMVEDLVRHYLRLFDDHEELLKKVEAGWLFKGYEAKRE